MKVATGIFAVLVLLLAMPAALAHEDNASAAEAASAAAEDEGTGITPDSPLYFLDTAFSRISLALTFDKADRAEKGLAIAQERLLELKAMAKRGKLEGVAKAEAEYESALGTATKAAEEIESDGKPNAARDAMEKISWLQNQTESHSVKVTAVKDEILQRQKERMSPEQIAQLQKVFIRIEEKAREVEIKLDSKKDKIKIKEKVLANLTSEQVDALERNISEKTGLSKGRQGRAEKEIERAKEAIEHAKEKMLEKKAKGANVDEVEKLLEEAEENAEKLSAHRDKTNKSAQYDAEELTNLGNRVSEIAESLGDAKKEGNFSEALDRLKETIRERREGRRAERLEKEQEDESDDDDERSGRSDDREKQDSNEAKETERKGKKDAETAGQQPKLTKQAVEAAPQLVRESQAGKNKGPARQVADITEKLASGKEPDDESDSDK